MVFTPMFCNQFFPWPGAFAKVGGCSWRVLVGMFAGRTCTGMEQRQD